MKTVNLSCQNPNCQHFAACGSMPPVDPLTVYEALPAGEIALPSLEHDSDTGFAVARFHGSIGPAYQAMAEEITALTPASTPALFLEFESDGGAIVWADKLLAAVVQYRLRGGFVVAHIIDAMSAAFELAMVADHVFIDENGFAGGVGALSYFCDGIKPMLLVSHQTPRKGLHTREDQPKYLCSLSDHNHEQAQLNELCDNSYRLIATARGLPIEKVKADHQGQAMKARDLFFNGYADEIATTKEAWAKIDTMLFSKRLEGAKKIMEQTIIETTESNPQQVTDMPDKRVLLSALCLVSGYKKHAWLSVDLIRHNDIQEVRCPYLVYDLPLNNAVDLLVVRGWHRDIAVDRLLIEDVKERQKLNLH